MEMPALNVMGIEIYFRIPKYLLYILKDHRYWRKSIWNHNERILKECTLVSHHGQLKEGKKETRKIEEIRYWQKDFKQTARERDRWWWMVPAGTQKGKTERKGDILGKLKIVEQSNKSYKQRERWKRPKGKGEGIRGKSDTLRMKGTNRGICTGLWRKKRMCKLREETKKSGEVKTPRVL